MPSIFLTGGSIFKKTMQDAMPEKRRMDNFELKVDYPSEEEFAFANLTPYSLYHGLAFPQNIDNYTKYCSFEGVHKRKVKKWKKAVNFFLKKITYHSKGKQMVLKNPANTARVKLLLEMYPNAKFIHIRRNPYEVFMSTKKMYNTMIPYFYLQEPKGSVKDFITKMYLKVYRSYLKEKELIPEDNLIEISYEQLMENPMKTVKKIYQKLDLPNYENSKSDIQEYIYSQRNYKTNRYSFSKKLIEEISERWKLTIDEWGYEAPA
jgi:hypothetical protein